MWYVYEVKIMVNIKENHIFYTNGNKSSFVYLNYNCFPVALLIGYTKMLTVNYLGYHMLSADKINQQRLETAITLYGTEILPLCNSLSTKHVIFILPLGYIIYNIKNHHLLH